MNKQIEEMADALRTLDALQYNPNYTVNYQRAVGLYSLGYRKASEVEKELADWKAIAEQYQKQFEDCYEEKEKIASEVVIEIFAEIEQAIFAHGTKYAMKRLAELKKKYEVTEE